MLGGDINDNVLTTVQFEGVDQVRVCREVVAGYGEVGEEHGSHSLAHVTDTHAGKEGRHYGMLHCAGHQLTRLLTYCHRME